MKSAMDRLASILLLFFFSPLMILLGVIIKLDSKGPVFFKQRRIGKNKVEFDILKFRTMRTDTPKDMPTHLLSNPEAFITKSGRLLRRSSLDELPQLINIAKGEMSFVGPRPALWNQENLIALRDSYNANSVKPGLTGWAQVNGRDELPIEVKARLDGEYINMQSLVFDIYILFKTLLSVVRSEGIKEGNK
jgi:O-antigen biosynthesis protein WbqP